MAAVAIVSLAAACGSARDTGGGATTTTTATISARSPLSLDRADLAGAKTFTTHRFRPPLTFTTGPGPWYVENRDSATDFSIGTEQIPGASAATIGWHR